MVGIQGNLISVVGAVLFGGDPWATSDGRYERSLLPWDAAHKVLHA